MQSIKGTVSSVKILQFSERPLVYFKLDDVNCLISANALSFLADVADNMQIVVAGAFNDHKQFVVRKYSVIGKTKIMMDLESVYH